ncbi:MAG: DUF3106 domain-containing protein [Xanthomonadales bacterium]|nr:DUF3106 domain-containing protein [Xanthomonadales bacterium]
MASRRAPERLRPRLGAVLAALLGGLPPCLLAAAPARFEELPVPAQRVLAPFRDGWAGLPPERREALARAAEVWLELGAEQRRLAARRLEIWERLTPEERLRLRGHLRRGGAALAGRPAPFAELLATLDPQERRALLERLRALPRIERLRLRQWLLGACAARAAGLGAALDRGRRGGAARGARGAALSGQPPWPLSVV